LKSFEARNSTHQMKKLTKDDLKEFRDRLHLPISDAALEADLPPYFHPGENSDEINYLLERRRALGGFLPSRVVKPRPVKLPGAALFQQMEKGSGKQAVATTMAFVRLFRDLIKDPEIGNRFVPIIPDEARTFGLDSIFPTAKIYSPHGQTYDAVDRSLLLSYKESTSGQILHEGNSEAGAMGSLVAAGTAYATHGEHMIPVYIFYSMFGFQRTGDAAWAFADQLGRGFMIGATAGRTTLNGEGLQHEDGHSQLLASTNPACVAYDPAFGFEIGHIVQAGLKRMYGSTVTHPHGEDVFYYLTMYNEPYVQPAQPAGLDVEALLKGLYRYQAAPDVPNGVRAQLLASGPALIWALEAQARLAEEWGVAADVWSATSWSELRRDAMAADEHNLLHPESEPRLPHVTKMLTGAPGPVVAVSDWMKAVPDQIARWVPGTFTSLGTDGWGRSDTRAALRRHFGVDAQSIVVRTLAELANRGEMEPEAVRKALDAYRLTDVTATTAQEAGGET
jgi:pyruvate dehydrogenase E1 component